MSSGGARRSVPEPRNEETMEYLRDGSGNEGEGRAVAVGEGRSTGKEVARELRKPALE